MAPKALLPVDDALSQLLAGITPLEAEAVPLAQAHGRVLASDLLATRTQPPFPASAMDGYAARHADFASGQALKVVGSAAAGHPFGKALAPGEAVRIFTGGVVPTGADTILIQEDAVQDGDQLTVTEVPGPGAFVRKAGLDFAEGDTLLGASTVLDPRALALAAAGGHGTLNVRRKPRVGIIATGDELRLPGEPTGPGEIAASNSFGLAAQCERHGAVAIDLGIARDTEASLKDRITAAIDTRCDVLITLGGASVGDHDLVQPVLRDLGTEIAFWKIAMRPGKPLMTGTLGAMTVLGLPGNPVSAMVCGQVFVVPLIKRLLGLSPDGAMTTARLAHDLTANGPRAHYMRAVMTETSDGTPTVEVFENQDSSVLSLLAKANCLVMRPVGDPALEAGARVKVLLL